MPGSAVVYKVRKRYGNKKGFLHLERPNGGIGNEEHLISYPPSSDFEPRDAIWPVTRKYIHQHCAVETSGNTRGEHTKPSMQQRPRKRSDPQMITVVRVCFSASREKSVLEQMELDL